MEDYQPTRDERSAISDEDREAFRCALWAYDAWIDDPHTCQLEATMRGKPSSVELICDVVKQFHGTMPSDHYDFLCRAAHQYTGETVPAPDDHSYAAGARCLRALIVYKKGLDDPRRK